MTEKAILLHLSDLHFGDENETSRAKRANTLRQLLLTLKELPKEWKPQSITISGDLGWHGMEKDYTLLESWLMELLKTLGLSPNDIITAPGNHDINLKIAATTAVPSSHNNADELLDLDLLKGISLPFKDFQSFCKRMNIPPLTLGSQSSYLAGCREHNGIMWLVLNSAWFFRKGRKEKLHIGLPHLELISNSERWNNKMLPTIGILHHPPECLDDEELNSYGNRRNTYDFLAGECHMVLSGHVHGMLTHPDTKFQKSLLFTGGSSYSGETVRNNVSLFKLDTANHMVERRAYEWNSAAGQWEYRENYSKRYLFPDGEAAPKPTKEGDLHRCLFNGSRRYYENLRGDNGRFRHLDISDIILQQPNQEWLEPIIKSFTGAGGGSSEDPLPDAAPGTDEGSFKLLDIIPMLWREGCVHVVLKGDGGMGKTVSLVRLWDQWTQQYNANRPVPIFIQLNEINTVPEEKRMDFILDTIRREYLDNSISEDQLLSFLKQSRDVPAVVLLLDGFHEVTVNHKELLIQIRKFMEQVRGLQLLITSRYDMRKTYGWGNIHLLELSGLRETQVRKYLEKKNTSMPEGDLMRLLINPMMLTLYASTCEVQGKYPCNFKDKVTTAGELLWNFMEAQVAVLLERLNYDQKKWWFYKFLMTFMLPAIGYEMEKTGLFAFDRDDLCGVLDTYCSRFGRDDFFRTFPDYEEYEEDLKTGTFKDAKINRKRRSEIINILCDTLLMMVKEGKTYRFLHQDFRDYFAARHILHEVEIGIKRKEITEVIKKRALPVHVRRFIGEIEGEHNQKPVFQKGKGWQSKENRSSLLNRVLDLCRGVFDGSVGFLPWNIVEIWKDIRGELSGTKLSNLDLSKVVLNGTLCSRFFNSNYLEACFDGSLLHERSIFPRGHSTSVNRTIYSRDGKKILSASSDHTIKEWDVSSGQCLRTFTGHKDTVNKAIYNNEGKRILSASNDRTIKEWDVESGQCLKTFSRNNSAVNSIAYSDDGKKILSGSFGVIKEWDVESGHCLKTFVGHEYAVESVCYSIDGKKILSASRDGTIKEWDVSNEQCLQTINGHDGGVNSAIYSSDGKRILSASWDATVKEWDVESGQCLKTFTGHNRGVLSAVYSGSEERILTASHDNTIKEWNASSGQCLKTFTGHNQNINSAVYSGDEKKILSASSDRTIKEWDMKSGQCLKSFSEHADGVYCALYSSDGKKILCTSWDNTIKEWGVESGQCLKIFKGHTDWINGALYNDDGEKILSASHDRTIKVWDTKSGQCLKTFTGPDRGLKSVLYGGDGKKTPCESWVNAIKEWRVSDTQYIKIYNGNLGAEVHPEGSGEKLETTNNKIEIKEGKTNATIRTFTNIPGLFIQGCSFKNLHPDSALSEECKNHLRQYGAGI